MLFSHAFLLSLIQGITEFLPVSSTAHLFVAEHLLHLPEDLSVKIAVHAGSLLAVIFYCRQDLFQWRNMRLSGDNPIVLIALASLPVFVAGFLFYERLASFSFADSYRWLAAANIFFALLLLAAHYCRPYQPHITPARALLIGLAQMLALFPGVSRSGVVLTAGLFLGLRRKQAAHFSFLLAIPVIAGAFLAQSFELLLRPSSMTTSWPVLLASFVFSAVFALSGMHFFIALLERAGIIPFVIYRLAFGAFILILFI